MAGVLRRLWAHLPTPVRALAHRIVNTGLGAYRLASVRYRQRVELNDGPLIVVGLHGSVLGVGQTARLFSRALQSAGPPSHSIDLAGLFGLDAGLWEPGLTPPDGGVVISHLNPPEMMEWLRRGGHSTLAGRRHIGYWVWELPNPPPTWKHALAYVDEVWCPSEFAADAIRRLGSPHKVRVVPPPIAASLTGVSDRARFGWRDGEVIVLSVLDFRSTAARKNPLGALRIFKRAQALSRAPARFVCKVTGLKEDASQEAISALRRDGVVVIDQDVSEQQMADLIASADVVLSAHRSEGFGLVLAEAMLAGRCVCATAWSGNIDFMSENTAVLLPYNLSPTSDPTGIYAASVWAEPDEEASALKLAEILSAPALRQAFGLRAQTAFNQRSSLDEWIDLVTRTVGTGGTK